MSFLLLFALSFASRGGVRRSLGRLAPPIGKYRGSLSGGAAAGAAPLPQRSPRAHSRPRTRGAGRGRGGGDTRGGFPPFFTGANLCQPLGFTHGVVLGSIPPCLSPHLGCEGSGADHSPNMALQIPPSPHHALVVFHSPCVRTLPVRLPKRETCLAPETTRGAEEGDEPPRRLQIRETQAGEINLPPQRPPLGSTGCSLVKYNILCENNLSGK